MLTLFQLPRAWGIPNLSPPCAKLETWLRIAKIPYEVGLFDTEHAPKGKFPYIQDDGPLAGDATLLLDGLQARYGVDPDAQLAPAERAVGLAFRRMLKEDFYWAIVSFRWRPEANFALMRAAFDGFLPPVVPAAMRAQIIDGARANLLAQLQHQGMGRHTLDEVARLGIADLTAVADYLSDKQYFHGAQPTTTDATVYAALSNVIDAPVPSPLRDFALSRANLVAYTRRMEAQFWPELAAARS